MAYKKSAVLYYFNVFVVHAFFHKQLFYKQPHLKLAKNQVNAKQHPEVELLLLFTFFTHVIIEK